MDKEIREAQRAAIMGDPRAQQKLESLNQRTDLNEKDPWDFDVDEESLKPPSNQWDVKSYLLLDPEARTVTAHLSSYGRPFSVHHNTARFVSVPSGAFHEDVLEVLNNSIEELDEIAEAYKGSVWNGNNHIGSWEENIHELIESLEGSFEGVRCYCNADDFFTGESLSAFTQSHENIGAALEFLMASDGVVLDEDDVLDFLAGLIAERVDEIEEEIEGLEGDIADVQPEEGEEAEKEDLDYVKEKTAEITKLRRELDSIRAWGIREVENAE